MILTFKQLGNSFTITFGLIAILILSGCESGSITAVNLDNPTEPEGIPYYLPKPYLVVCKNVRYIPTPTVGLTQTAAIPNSFDTSSGAPSGNSNPVSKGGQNSGSQQTNASAASPPSSTVKDQNKTESAGQQDASNNVADTLPSDSTSKAPTTNTGPDNSNVSSQVTGPAAIAVVPPASIPDGLTPDTFYTYQIIYLPDLTQKYGLRVKGGDGEMRATLNLVNGWMHTGPGPVYFRDSTTAEDVSAAFTGVSSTLQSGASLFSAIHGYPAGAAKSNSSGNQIQSANGGIASGPPTYTRIKNFAAIWVYEPEIVFDSSVVGGKRLKWSLMTDGAPIIMSRIVEQESAAPDGAGDQAGGAQPPDANPSLTAQANTIIHGLAGMEAVKALRSAKNATGWTIVIDTQLSTSELVAVQTALASLKVTQVSVRQ